MRNIFTLKGTASRREFFFAFTAVLAVAYLTNNLREYLYPLSESGIVQYALIKNFLAILYLALLQPFIVRRLRDINVAVWWVLLFWVSLPLSSANILAVQQLLGIQLNFAKLPLQWDLLYKAMYLVAIPATILFILLFVVQSRHNKQLKDRPFGPGTAGGKPPSAP